MFSGLVLCMQQPTQHSVRIASNADLQQTALCAISVPGKSQPEQAQTETAHKAVFSRIDLEADFQVQRSPIRDVPIIGVVKSFVGKCVHLFMALKYQWLTLAKNRKPTL
jgi:hypothetical protein